MAYGTVKVDNITFDNGGSDQNVTVSGLYRATTSGVTVTGTISGAVLVGTTTVSGATVTGNVVQGTTVQGVSGTFTSLTGTTTTGTTANFVSGVFTTQVSGTTVTGTTSNFTSGNFATLSGATATFTSGIIASGTAAAPSLAILADLDTGLFSSGANQVAVATNGTQRLLIDSGGRLLIGTSTSTDYYGATAKSYITDQGGANLPLALETFRDDSAGAYLILGHSRSGTAGNYTILQSNDGLGLISFNGSDGTDLVSVGATIKAEVDGTPGADDMPGRLVFSTTADGASSPTEKMRITNNGSIFFGKTVNDFTTEGVQIRQSNATTGFVTGGGTVITFSRTTNDGTIVSLRQDGIEEGTISVSGTTVSYNGAHLSRWSQLPSAAERTDILRGSVLSNLDEMCEWGEEDNEQLNRMKVSDVEGDKNVSGVFQCWDDDDDTYTNDFYCAMTGDFIIRIAEGVTVERGDLLMSAGDGTAKPQDDDIIRSKTIAKVTSTNVSCTYADNSYCVPCVLMAC
jgi:hypothetical protein